MKASVSVICYKHKVLANGESPLMLRIAKDGKRTMKSLGISVNPTYWDFGRNQPKNNCPNRNLIKQTASIVRRSKATTGTIEPAESYKRRQIEELKS